MQAQRRHKHHQAFTLIELLVVVAIIALLIAILLPALQNAREVTQRVRCGTNLRTLLMSAHSYADDNNDYMPMPNWAYFDPQPGWLYYGKSESWEKKIERRDAGYEVGALWPYVLDAGLYRCPRHTPPFTGSALLSSYLMNGAAVDYGYSIAAATQKATYQTQRFRSDSVIFWEPPEKEIGASFNDGSSSPDQDFTERHLGFASLAHIDGHVSWIRHRKWELLLEATPGPLWCAPGLRYGAPPGWENPPD